MSGGRKVDVLLVNPSSRSSVYQGLGRELAAVENPIWAGLLARFCQTAGLSVELIDAEAEEFSAEVVAELVREAGPVLTAIAVYGHQPSASTQSMTAVGQVCREIKRLTPEQKVILIGGHVAALPIRTLEEEETDFVAAGEGLYTIVGLVDALKTPSPNYSRVPGLWYRRDGKPVSTPDVPLVTDLDTRMPGPAWELFPMGRYRAHNWHCLNGYDRKPYAALYTTLGCPYRCTFCCIQAPFRSGEQARYPAKSGNSYRYWTAEAVLSQIDLLIDRYGIKNIKIADEMFVLNRRHVMAICEGLIQRKAGLNIWAYARVDTIRSDMLGHLREAGFTWLALGIEAGVLKVREGVDKAIDQEKVVETIARIRAAGINVIGNYIFGLPDDDELTMRSTLDLAVELNCEFSNFYSAMAYPGSRLFEMAVEEDIPLPRAWTGYAQHSRDCLPLPTRYVTAKEVLTFRDAAFGRYFGGVEYRESIRRRFGTEKEQEMARMTDYPLERDLLTGALSVPSKKMGIGRDRSPGRSLTVVGAG